MNKEEKKQYMKEYRQRPEVKKRKRERKRVERARKKERTDYLKGLPVKELWREIGYFMDNGGT